MIWLPQRAPGDGLGFARDYFRKSWSEGFQTKWRQKFKFGKVLAAHNNTTWWNSLKASIRNTKNKTTRQSTVINQ